MGSLLLNRRSSQSSLKMLALTVICRFISVNPLLALSNAVSGAQIHTCAAGSVLPNASPCVELARSFHSGQVWRARLAVADYSDAERASSVPADEGLEISKLDISPLIVSALKNMGIKKLFSIQRAVLEPALQRQNRLHRVAHRVEGDVSEHDIVQKCVEIQGATS